MRTPPPDVSVPQFVSEEQFEALDAEYRHVREVLRPKRAERRGQHPRESSPRRTPRRRPPARRVARSNGNSSGTDPPPDEPPPDLTRLADAEHTPRVLIDLALESWPRVLTSAATDDEATRLADWILSQDDLCELIDRALLIREARQREQEGNEL